MSKPFSLKKMYERKMWKIKSSLILLNVCLCVSMCVCVKSSKKNCNLSHSILYQHFTFLFSFSSFKSSCNNSATFTNTLNMGCFQSQRTIVRHEKYLNTLVATYITTTSSFSCFNCQRYISTSIITIYGKSLIHLFGHISEYEIFFSAFRIQN